MSLHVNAQAFPKDVGPRCPGSPKVLRWNLIDNRVIEHAHREVQLSKGRDHPRIFHFEWQFWFPSRQNQIADPDWVVILIEGGLPQARSLEDIGIDKRHPGEGKVFVQPFSLAGKRRKLALKYFEGTASRGRFQDSRGL
ncbi:hypothetical protein FRC09_019577 [Ceratobasidium sp. 395]|nr:hypothetical protein FRC09_019577 [Ceratobasidium sp. 395]